MALDFGLIGDKGQKIVGESGFFAEVDSSGRINITGSVTFPSAQTVQFDSAQAVTISSGTVSISGTPTVSISGTPAVTVTSGSISIAGTPDVNVANATIAVTSSGTWNINDVGEIILNKERWNQVGSTLINDLTIGIADINLFTVTSGKDFFLKKIFIRARSNMTAGDSFELRDGGSGGTRKITVGCVLADDTNLEIDITPPIKFATDVYCNEIGSTDLDLLLQGWEEAE